MEIITLIAIKNQVNKLLLRIRKASHCKSHKFHQYATKVLYPLTNRSLVKVSGHRAAPFLQGLITNDMNNLGAGTQSLYAMFLCNRGKVLYDTIIHKWGGKADNIFMLECDKSVHYLLQQHLKDYYYCWVKKGIQIEDVTELYRLWALIAPPDFHSDLSETNMKHNIFAYKDPRLEDLGHRLFTTPDMGHILLRQAIGHNTFIQGDDKDYQALRYNLGVSEGAEDLFPGTCFPIEANCDYLGGLSLKKKSGYVGKDVTVCFQRTGVRKRIMPIYFLGLEIEKEKDLPDAKIWANRDCGRNHVGTLINRVGSFGLGLLNVEETLEAKTLHVGSNPIEVTKPNWWPEEYSKEKSPFSKNSLDK